MDMNLKQLSTILVRRRAWLLTPLALAMAAGAGASFVMTPVYQANAKILLEHHQGIISPFDGESDDVGQLSAVSQKTNPIDTQAELLKSAPVLAHVIAELGLLDETGTQPMSVSAFRERARVTALRGTDMLEIRFEHPDPATAQAVATAWARAFREENRAGKRVEASETARFVAAQVGEARKQLEAAEKALRDYKQANQTINLSEEARSSVAALAALEAQLREAVAGSQEASTRASSLRQRIGMSASQALTATAAGQDPGVQRLRQQLLEAETSPALSDAALGPQHPDVKAARARVEALRQSLQQHLAGTIGRQAAPAGAPMDSVRQSLAHGLVSAEVDSLTQQTRAAALRRLIAEMGQRLQRMPQKEMELSRFERRAATAAELYQSLVKREAEVKLQAAMGIGNVRIVEEASLPKQPVRPRKAFNLLIALLFGGTLGVGLAVLRDRLDETVRSVKEVERALALPNAGRIPWLANGEDAQLAAEADPHGPQAETYRTLRTYVNFLAVEPPKTLIVTSASPGEGKSMVASNLAVVYARAGKRVLLVDADMRRPSLHRIFGLDGRQGLSTLLLGRAGFDAVVQGGPSHGLDILPAGPVLEDPADRLGAGPMDMLLAKWSEAYDIIIFDSPPVLATSDACVLGARLDGALMVVGVGKVTPEGAKEALKLLQSARTRVLGTVVNGIRPDGDPIHYYATYAYSEAAKPQKLLPPPAAS